MAHLITAPQTEEKTQTAGWHDMEITIGSHTLLINYAQNLVKFNDIFEIAKSERLSQGKPEPRKSNFLRDWKNSKFAIALDADLRSQAGARSSSRYGLADPAAQPLSTVRELFLL